jgi:hypothetical protein
VIPPPFWRHMALITYTYLCQALGMFEYILYYCQHPMGRFNSLLMMMMMMMPTTKTTMIHNWGQGLAEWTCCILCALTHTVDLVLSTFIELWICLQCG